MPNVYFAKFNINDEIYNVYKDKDLLNKLLFDIYQGIRGEVVLQDPDGEYKFISIDKNPETNVVNGRIVLYAPGTHTSYDRQKDDVIEMLDETKATYITFSFDVKREIVGFVPKRDFGRMQFIAKFKNLVEECTNVGEVELFLETNIQLLNEKIKPLEHVKEVSVTLIPPNNDQEEFNVLFSTNSEELKETNATKFDLALFGTARRSVNVASEYVQKWVRAIGLGYGKMKVVGRNRSGEEVRVSSEEEAPYTRPIFDNAKDSIPEVAEKTRAGITHLSAVKARGMVELDGHKEE